MYEVSLSGYESDFHGPFRFGSQIGKRCDRYSDKSDSTCTGTIIDILHDILHDGTNSLKLDRSYEAGRQEVSDGRVGSARPFQYHEGREKGYESSKVWQCLNISIKARENLLIYGGKATKLYENLYS